MVVGVGMSPSSGYITQVHFLFINQRPQLPVAPILSIANRCRLLLNHMFQKRLLSVANR